MLYLFHLYGELLGNHSPFAFLVQHKFEVQVDCCAIFLNQIISVVTDICKHFDYFFQKVDMYVRTNILSTLTTMVMDWRRVLIEYYISCLLFQWLLVKNLQGINIVASVLVHCTLLVLKLNSSIHHYWWLVGLSCVCSWYLGVAGVRAIGLECYRGVFVFVIYFDFDY